MFGKVSARDRVALRLLSSRNCAWAREGTRLDFIAAMQSSQVGVVTDSREIRGSAPCDD
jgi:hypothetical protein